MTEKNEVKRDGAKPQKNSGRGSHDKADAILGPFCYDVKEYIKGYTVSLNAWAKICTDAYKSGSYQPALKIVRGSGNDKVRLWVVSDEMMKEMLEKWSN